MGEKEGMESIEQLSLILEGVGKIPESCVIVIQTALEEHTTSIVKSIYPDIHFHSTIRLLSVTSNDISKRNLRPSSQGVPSVTIIFNELGEFQPAPGTENMKGSTFASLAFQTPKYRQAFVNKIHEISSTNMLQSLVGVSTVTRSPTILSSSNNPEVPVPTTSRPTDDESDESPADNDLSAIIGDGMLEDADGPSTSKDDLPMSVMFIAVIIGLGLITGAVAVMVKRLGR